LAGEAPPSTLMHAGHLIDECVTAPAGTVIDFSSAEEEGLQRIECPVGHAEFVGRVSYTGKGAKPVYLKLPKSRCGMVRDLDTQSL